ncbi:MAG: hypothetical protein GZ094_13620 [Mariniphaga sp.]|nr:hypothetical protein [Mariniphaga sp.]
MKIIFYLTQILVFLFFHIVSAKTPVNGAVPIITPWEIGLSTGASIYGTSFIQKPDATYMRNSFWYRDVNPAIGLFAVRNISPSIGIEMSWLNTCLSVCYRLGYFSSKKHKKFSQNQNGYEDVDRDINSKNHQRSC